MMENELRMYDALPEEVVIYRGYSLPDRRLGLSWSLDLGTASWFAHRFAEKNQVPTVVRATCRKADIHAVFLRRGEVEVVIDPENVRFVKTWNPPARDPWLVQLWAICTKESKFAGPNRQTPHGPSHWAKVEANAIALAKRIKGCDIAVVRAFASARAS